MIFKIYILNFIDRYFSIISTVLVRQMIASVCIIFFYLVLLFLLLILDNNEFLLLHFIPDICVNKNKLMYLGNEIGMYLQ